jgi:hypothetical protein
LPERHWVRRRLEEIGEDKEYLQLARDWQRHRSNYEADPTKLKPLTKFKEETVWPFANSRLRFLTELVVQAYIKDALEAIGLNHSYPVRRPPGAHGLPKSVLEGRCGLCWHTFHTLVSRSDGDTRRTARLELKFIRGGNAIRNTKEGKPNLAGRYNNSAAKVSWVNKLMELFYIANDDILGAKKEDRVRVWEQCNFRQKTRRLIQLLEESFDDDNQLADYWTKNLARMASQYLWAVPYFDKSHLGFPLPAPESKQPQTIYIIVPTIQPIFLNTMRKDLRKMEEPLRQEIRDWFTLQPKSEDGEDGSFPTNIIIPATLAGIEKTLKTMRDRENSVELNMRDRILQKARSIYCHPIRLFESLQSRVSVQRLPDIRLDSKMKFYSKRAAKVIGLQGRNQVAMVDHIRALHPSLSHDEAGRVMRRCINWVKDLGKDLYCSEQYRSPVIEILPSRSRPGERKVSEFQYQGALLFAAFGDVLNLTTIDEYMTSIDSRQRHRRHTQQAADIPRENNTTQKSTRTQELSILSVNSSVDQDSDTVQTPAKRRRVSNRRQSSVTSYLDDSHTIVEDGGIGNREMNRGTLG